MFIACRSLNLSHFLTLPALPMLLCVHLLSNAEFDWIYALKVMYCYVDAIYSMDLQNASDLYHVYFDKFLTGMYFCLAEHSMHSQDSE